MFKCLHRVRAHTLTYNCVAVRKSIAIYNNNDNNKNIESTSQTGKCVHACVFVNALCTDIAMQNCYRRHRRGQCRLHRKKKEKKWRKTNSRKAKNDFSFFAGCGMWETQSDRVEMFVRNNREMVVRVRRCGHRSGIIVIIYAVIHRLQWHYHNTTRG